MTNEQKIKRQITAALKALKVTGRIKVTNDGINRYKILRDGVYFGVFDTEKNTFVD